MPEIWYSFRTLHRMKRFVRNNGLSLAFLLLFIISMYGQIVTGLSVYNQYRMEHGRAPVSFLAYFYSGHFLQATFENWESEFLQMALFVGLTVSLRQKGSSESRKVHGREAVDREPDKRKKDAPWPVRVGGLPLLLYKHSLTIALALLFILSFAGHIYGSLRDENEQLATRGLASQSVLDYIADSRFWFESFQNWQSEFLSVWAIVVLSIFLRQKGSPQSKPVDAPDSQTGS